MTKQKNNSLKKRRVLLSLLMICLTGVVLSTSTYAWFTANKQVTVSDINVTVAASNGIQVSVDGATWKTVISNKDITDAHLTYEGATNQLPTGTNALSPVSTIGAVNAENGFVNMFSGDIASDEHGNYILTASAATEENRSSGDYIAFDLFVQVNEETDVYLTSDSKVVASGTSTGIQNASRVAFVLSDPVAIGSAIGDIQAAKADADSTVVIWEPNNDAHTAAAVANAISNYGVSEANITEGTGNAALGYYGVKAIIGEEALLPLNSDSETYVEAVTPAISTATTGISSEAYEQVFTLNPGITKVRVYMWLEGQDVDCENNASGGSATFSVQFSSNSAA